MAKKTQSTETVSTSNVSQAEFEKLMSGMKQAGGLQAKVLDHGEVVHGTWIREETRLYNKPDGTQKPGKVYVVQLADGKIRAFAGAAILDSQISSALIEGLAPGCTILVRRSTTDLAPKAKGKNGAGDYEFYWQSN